jgi:site-specific recombinase XerC
MKTTPCVPPVTAAPVEATIEQLGGAYRRYLVEERGLIPLTVHYYLRTAGVALAYWCGDDPRRLVRLSADDVASFVLSESRRGLSPRTVNEIVVRLRSLLRFLYLRGYVTTPLAQAAPWLASSREHSLPRALDPAVGPKLIASCHPTRLMGIRDRAMLTLIVRLGLRRVEITELRLDDIDWRNGVITVRGKGRATDQLPLPADVGDALADYLSVRGPDPRLRHVFWTSDPPRPLTPTAVSAVVQRACARIGVPDTGTHRFRHSAGAELLRRGAALPEVGQLLRHHHLQTTAGYARVDLTALAEVTQPWPGARS